MKVHVRRVQTGVAAASTLLAAAGAGTLGCAEETQGSEESNLDAVASTPGSAQLELQFGSAGMLAVQLKNSTTDEFVRVGEKLTIAIPAWLLWEELYPNDPIPTDDARFKQLKATVKLVFLDKDKTISTKSLTTSTWKGSSYNLEAFTGSATVPKKTDTIQLALTIKDTAAGGATMTLAVTQLGSVPVFGGELPNKSLLLDNNGSDKRERVVDGDLPAKGSKLTLGFTDWRADQVVDKVKLNTQIGTAQFSGRMGWYEAPIFGTLTYEVWLGVSTDGGETFGAEQALTPNTASRFTGPNRTVYEGSLDIPKDATEIEIYGHVKATLTCDYSKYSNVKQKWYGDGEKKVIKEAWDNPGPPNTNYVVPLQ